MKIKLRGIQSRESSISTYRKVGVFVMLCFVILSLMWKKLSSKILFTHPRLVVEEDEVEISPDRTIQYLRYGYGGDGVVVVAQNDKHEILFIKESSYVINKRLLQLPMGKIEEGESAEIAANRELQEETGLRAKAIVQKGSYYQNHRRSTNKGMVLLASDLEASELQADEEEQDIEKVWLPVRQVASEIANGNIIDADTLSSLLISGICTHTED